MPSIVMCSRSRSALSLQNTDEECFRRRERSDLTRDEIAADVLHPGGQKLLSCVDEHLGLCRCDTQFSWDVLSQYGNLSSATILCILHEWLTKKTITSCEYGLAAAFGPGFSAEALLLQWN